MNEFIVWDKDCKDFLNDFDRKKLSIKIIEDCKDLGNMARFTFHQYIGKKDINNNKIYADCSIVEFEYKDTSDKYIEKGVFKYHNDLCFYYIEDFRGTLFHLVKDTIRNIKIIDTVQENKLELIK